MLNSSPPLNNIHVKFPPLKTHQLVKWKGILSENTNFTLDPLRLAIRLSLDSCLSTPVYVHSRTYIPSHLGRGGGDLLARKIYIMPECVSVEIRMQTNSHCMANKRVKMSPFNETDINPKVFISKLAYSVTSINSLDLLKYKSY